MTELAPFMVFFVSFIILFSILFQILGLELFLDDYYGFKMAAAYFVYAYRNAIGDVQTPVYNFWLKEADDNPNLAWSMIILIWFFWFINQLINLIILLNFLIALISKAYEEIMSE